MSAENIGTHFVDDLVNMALTAKRVPELEAKIRNLETADELNAHTITELNKQIIDHVNAHAETKLQLRAAEVARDDAELRFLEVDDHKLSLVRTLQTVVAEAQEMLRAIEPAKAEPDYSGKWLTDVMGWNHITLERWIECGGRTEHFTVVKPLEPTPVPLASESTQPNKVQTEPLSVSDQPLQTQEVGTTSIEGVSVERDPATSSAGENSSSLPQSIQGQSEANPTVPTTNASSLPSATSLDTAGAEEVAPTGPFVSSTTSQSQCVLIGDAESKTDVSSPAEPQPKAEEDGEFEWWHTPSRTSHYS